MNIIRSNNKNLNVFQVEHYSKIQREHDLSKVVSVLRDSTLTRYDIKLLDKKPSKSEVNILEAFAKRTNVTYRKGWINDMVCDIAR